tara:strand:- start:22036 stop:25221 length:3186 start_codon:yes stop_codon:yes gene_type:complete
MSAHDLPSFDSGPLDNADFPADSPDAFEHQDSPISHGDSDHGDSDHDDASHDEHGGDDDGGSGFGAGLDSSNKSATSDGDASDRPRRKRTRTRSRSRKAATDEGSDAPAERESDGDSRRGGGDDEGERKPRRKRTRKKAASADREDEDAGGDEDRDSETSSRRKPRRRTRSKAKTDEDESNRDESTSEDADQADSRDGGEGEHGEGEGQRKKRRRGSRGGRGRKRKTETSQDDSDEREDDAPRAEDAEEGSSRKKAKRKRTRKKRTDDDSDAEDTRDEDDRSSSRKTKKKSATKKKRTRRKKTTSEDDADRDDFDDEEDAKPKRKRTRKKAGSSPEMSEEELAAEAEKLRTEVILVNACDPEEKRVAVVGKDHRISELLMTAESQKTLVNDIYRGRVVNLEPAIGAAFIDFGQGRNGFLHTSDVLPTYGEPGFTLDKLLTASIDPDDWSGDQHGEGEVDTATDEDKPKTRRKRTRSRSSGMDVHADGTRDGYPDEDDDEDDDEADEDGPIKGRASKRSSDEDDSKSVTWDDHGPDHLGDPEHPLGDDVDDDDHDHDHDVHGHHDDHDHDDHDDHDHDVDHEDDDAPEASDDDSDSDAEAGDDEEEGRKVRAPRRRSAKKASKKTSKAADKRGGSSRSKVHRRGRQRLPITDLLKVGDQVVVQITKDAIGDKGPTLTTYISIPGRYLVLMPSMARTGVSRKIPDERERRRLKRILASLEAPDDMGVIVRTAGIGRKKDDLKRDLDYLLGVWEEFGKSLKSGRGPKPLYQESNLAIRTLRDLFDKTTKEVIVDDPVVQAEMVAFAEKLMPEQVGRIREHDGDRPVFHHYGIEQDFEKVFSRRVELPSGGSIVFDQAEALVAIDVNSGRTRTDSHDFEEIALKTNLEAVPEMALQIRLRDLGGIIVCDFIDMMKSSSNRAVERALKNELADDRARSKFGRISQFGLLEMTRQRLGPGTHKKVFQACPRCRGTARIRTVESRAQAILRRLGSALTQKGFSTVEVRAHPEVVKYLKEDLWDWVRAMEHRSEREIQLTSVPDQSEDSVLRYLRTDGREVRPGGRRKR